jgi:exonuclease III
MLIVSWNVAGRVGRLDEQAQIVQAGADVICLQEVTPSTLERWSAHLARAGYRGLGHASFPQAGEPSRRLGVLTASRQALQEMPVAGVPWPERVLAVRLADGTDVVNVHSPTSPKPDLAKIRTHEALHRHLTTAPDDRPRVLCGDLNTPRKEHADGRVWTFARDRYGRLRADRGERWDQAELALIRGLEPHGWRDAFRSLHGYAARELSWEWAQWKGGYRLDHLLVSRDLEVESCWYEHAWRKAGLSDHSPLLAELRQTARRRSGRSR